MSNPFEPLSMHHQSTPLSQPDIYRTSSTKHILSGGTIFTFHSESTAQQRRSILIVKVCCIEIFQMTKYIYIVNADQRRPEYRVIYLLKFICKPKRHFDDTNISSKHNSFEVQTTQILDILTHFATD